jgi:hypothetical protein
LRIIDLLVDEKSNLEVYNLSFVTMGKILFVVVAVIVNVDQNKLID